MWRGGEQTLVQCHTSQFFALSGTALCAFENQKRFSTDVCKHTPVENFFGSLDTGQAVELVGMII